MSKNTKKKKGQKPASQSYLPIAQIKDGVVVLKDGTLRSVLLVSSINFALKSEDEQNALISSYVSFLNSLEYPLQVVIQSRKLQIQPYIDNLRKMQKEQTNELLKVQIGDYGSFISELVEIGEIMSKRFYVVVPYDPLSNKKKSFWARLQEAIKPVSSIRLKGERFDKRKEDLEMRVRQATSGLQSMGLQVVQMDTQALIELYYSTYNPDMAYAQQLQDINKIQVEQI